MNESDAREHVLNELLVSLFNKVMAAEGKAIITEEYSDITNNDMHIINAIGIGEPRSMSTIAKQLMVTVGTLTVNMNNLEKKDYIKKSRSTQDKRVVLVTLTQKGKQAFKHHMKFHMEMIRAAIEDLTEEERRVLVICLEKLNKFFTSHKIYGYLT